MTTWTAISPFPRPQVRAMLFFASALSIVLVLAMPPTVAVRAVTAVAVVLAVALEPRMAFFLLPITIPWGSALAGSSSPPTPSDLIVATLLVTWAVRTVARRDVEIEISPWLLALGLFLVAISISMAGAISITDSLKELAKWVEVLVVAALAPVYLRGRRDLWTVVLVVIGSAGCEAAMGLVQFLTHSGPRAFDIHGRFLRAYGTFGQPNPLAGYLNIVLPVTFAFAWMRRNVWLWLTAGVIAAGSVATLSRAGWAAGLLACAVVGLLLIRWLRPIAVIGSVAFVAYVTFTVLGAFPLQPLTKVATSFGITAINFSHHTHANFSEIERAAHWVAGLRMFMAHPFIGVGIGNYADAYPAFHVTTFTAPLGHAHNYFINVAAEAGILGAVAYLALVVVGFSSAAVAARSVDNNRFLGVLGVGVVGLWVSSTFHNLFDVLYVHEMQILIGLFMGLLVAAKFVYESDEVSPAPQSLLKRRTFGPSAELPSLSTS